jgi:hypothetical protein
MSKSTNTDMAQRGKDLLSKSKKELVKVGGAFTINMLMLVAIAEAFKWLKDDDDKEAFTQQSIQTEIIGNLLGLIPLGSEINSLMNGYNVSNMSYSALSNIYTAVKEAGDGITALVSGKYQSATELRKSIRKIALGLAQTFGIPLRNVETYLKAVIGKVSPASKEEYEALFETKSNTSYLAKITTAIENGDENTADRLINILFNNRTGKIKDDKVLDKTRDLIGKGYDVLAKTLNDTITYDGQSYELSQKQYNDYIKTYSQANDSIKQLVNTNSFTQLNDEAQAKAMRMVYDYYYNIGLQNLIGVDLENKNILFSSAIDIEAIATAYAKAQTTTGTTKKAQMQQFINTLSLKASQKYILMGYLGYSNTNGASIVKSYINSLKLSKEQKTALYKASGYKN